MSLELLHDRQTGKPDVDAPSRDEQHLDSMHAPSKDGALDPALKERVEAIAQDLFQSLSPEKSQRYSKTFSRCLSSISAIAADIQTLINNPMGVLEAEQQRSLLHNKLHGYEQMLTAHREQSASLEDDNNPFTKLTAICQTLDKTLSTVPIKIEIQDSREIKAGDVLQAENKRILFLKSPDTDTESVKVAVYDVNLGTVTTAQVTPSALLSQLETLTLERSEQPQLIFTAPQVADTFFVSDVTDISNKLPSLQAGDQLYRFDLMNTGQFVRTQVVHIDDQHPQEPMYSLIEHVDNNFILQEVSSSDLTDPEFGITHGAHSKTVPSELHHQLLQELISMNRLIREQFDISESTSSRLSTQHQARELLSEVLPGSLIVQSDGTRSLFLGLVEPTGAKRLLLTDTEKYIVETVSEDVCLGNNAQIGTRYLYPGKRERYDSQSVKWKDITAGDVFVFSDGSKKEILAVETGLNSTRAWVDSIHYQRNGTVELLRSQESNDLDLQSNALSKPDNPERFVSSPIQSVGIRTEARQSAQTGYFKHPAQNALASLCIELEQQASDRLLKQTVHQIQVDYLKHREKQSPAEQSPVDLAVHAGDQYLHDLHERSQQFQGQVASFLLDFVQEHGGFVGGKLILNQAFQKLAQVGTTKDPVASIRTLFDTLETNLPESTSADTREKLQKVIQRFNHFVELLPVDVEEDKNLHTSPLPLEGSFTVLDRNSITKSQLQQLMAIEQQKPGTPGSKEAETRGIITVKSTEAFLQEQLDEGMEIIVYTTPDQQGEETIKAFFNYYPSGSLPDEIRDKYAGVYEKLDSIAYLDLYAISDDLQEALRKDNMGGLMSTCLFAAHSHRGQSRGTDLLIGQIEQQNIPSLVTVLGELGVPNTYDVHVKHPGQQDESVWVSFALPASPHAKETFREYAGNTRPSRSKLIAQIKENARTTRTESRYCAQMKEAPGNQDLRVSIGAGNMNERQFDRMMEYFEVLSGYDGRMHLGGSEMIKRNTVNPDAPIRTKKNIYEMQQRFRDICPNARIGNIIMSPESGPTKTIMNERGEQEDVRVISSDENYDTIVLRDPDIAAEYEVSDVDWGLETKKAKELALRIHTEILEETQERDLAVPLVITGWEGGGGIYKELCDYAQTPLEGGIDLIILPESGGANERFYQAYQRFLDGDPDFQNLVHPQNRVHIAHSPEELLAITTSIGLQQKEAHEPISMSLSEEFEPAFA